MNWTQNILFHLPPLQYMCSYEKLASKIRAVEEIQTYLHLLTVGSCVYFLYRATTTDNWIRKWYKIKTTATDQWRWWPEHCDWWCMLDVRVQTISGSQEVNLMCANRNKRCVSVLTLLGITYRGWNCFCFPLQNWQSSFQSWYFIVCIIHIFFP